MPVAASRCVGILLKWRWPAAGAFLVVFAMAAPHDPAAGPLLQREVNLMLGLVLGSLTGIAVALTLESMDTRMKTAADVRAALGLPILGLVSTVRATGARGASLLPDRGVPAAFSEAIREISWAVTDAAGTGVPRRVMITSTAPGEGKSVLSSNLADSLGHAGHRTLLVDGDLRRPRVHEIFACAAAPGLSEVLSGAADVRTVIRSTANPNLSLLPAGQLHPDPATLLGPLRYATLIDELARDFDWIVVDAPPVLATRDVALMSHGVSRVIFVVGAEMVQPCAARAALEQLVAARAQLVGVVLNRVRMRRARSYAWKHRSAYTQAYGAHRV